MPVPLPPMTATFEPPVQEPEKPFGVAITNPAGKLSITFTLFSVSLLLGFAIWNVKDVMPFNEMVDAAKTLVSVGGNGAAKAVLLSPITKNNKIQYNILFIATN